MSTKTIFASACITAACLAIPASALAYGPGRDQSSADPAVTNPTSQASKAIQPSKSAESSNGDGATWESELVNGSVDPTVKTSDKARLTAGLFKPWGTTLLSLPSYQIDDGSSQAMICPFGVCRATLPSLNPGHRAVTVSVTSWVVDGLTPPHEITNTRAVSVNVEA